MSIPSPISALFQPNLPLLNLAPLSDLSSKDSGVVDQASARRLATFLFLNDLKELNSLKFEQDLLNSSFSPSFATLPDLLPPSYISPTAPDLSTHPLTNLTPANWRWLINHRADLRRRLLVASALSKDDDPVLCQLLAPLGNPSYAVLAAATVATYVRTCVTSVCALQAFIAVTARVSIVAASVQDSRFFVDVGLALAEKLTHEPEVVEYIFKVFRVFDALASSVAPDDAALVAAALEVVCGLPTASASPKKSEDRRLAAAAHIRKAAAKAAAAVVREPAEWTKDEWRVLAALGRLETWPVEVEVVVRKFVRTWIRWTNEAEAASVAASLECLAVFAGVCKWRPELGRLLDMLVGELDAEGEAMRRASLLTARSEISSLSVDKRSGGNISNNENRKQNGKVPKLRLEGLPVSMQGSSSIGAMPAEEASRLGIDEKPANVQVMNKSRIIRKIYSNERVHVNLLKLVFSIILTPNRKLIDEQFCDLLPHVNSTTNYLYFLDKHLNDQQNRQIVQILIQELSLYKTDNNYKELLKLMLDRGFSFDWLYKSKRVLGGGAFGTVIREQSMWGDFSATKFSTTSRALLDRSHLHAVHNEVVALRVLQDLSGVPDLLDYGLEGGLFRVTMSYCPLSVDKWLRDFQPELPARLGVFRQVLEVVGRMHAVGVIHYDLKAANILLTKEIERGTPVAKAKLGDLGEARVLETPEDPPCARNRGTEYIKSPEMFAVKDDRRKTFGTTAVSDVWSLGILLFELVTEHQLFSDGDWVGFFARISNSDSILASAECAMLAHDPRLIDFLNFVLIKDPARRPTARVALQRFDAIFPEASEAVCWPSVLDNAEVEVDSHDEGVGRVLADVFYGGISISESATQRFSVSEVITLVLVKEDFNYESHCRFVIDCRRRDEPPLFSPLQATLAVTRVDAGTVKNILSFARWAFFEGSKLEILDDLHTPDGSGFLVALTLLRQAQGIPQMTCAFLRVVNASLVSVTNRAIEAVRSLAEILPTAETAGTACFCGSVSFDLPEAPPTIKDLRVFSHFPAIMPCACTESLCPNQGKCALYLDWVSATFRPVVSELHWFLTPTRVSKSSAVLVDQDTRHGLESSRYKCRICGALTHIEISASADFLCTAVCVLVRAENSL